MVTRKEIRNSTAEFLIFQAETREQGVEVYCKEENIWATQKAISVLFDCDRSVVTKHLRNIFETGELDEPQVCAKFAHTASDGKNYNTKFYNLDAIIAVGYRVNSIRATQFRQFAIRGYVLDKKRMENGTFLDEDYFEHLLAEIREIRLSERRFYQKLTDIYATSMDYNKDAPTTRLFFKRIQNKMELEDMGRIVTAVLEFAESRAKRHIPMTMEDWAKRIDAYLSSDERPLVDNAGSVSHEEAVLHAETEFEKYRIIQDRLFQSDFDKFLGELPLEGK